jgi:hypothetical protein
MSDSRLPRFIFGLLVLFAVVHFWRLYAQLPDVVAAHFDSGGTPNGWQTKSVFFAFFAGAVAIAAFLTFGIPAIFSKLPMSLINLPHREYWLAPERRAETLAFLDSSFAWFGCVVLLVVIDAVNYAIGRNLHPGAQLDPPVPIYVLGGFFAFTILWSIRLLTHFAQIPRDGLAPK